MDKIPGEIVEYNGRQARELSNGSLQDVVTGKLLTAPKNPVHPYADPAIARQGAWLRWHGKRQQAIIDAVAASGADVPDIDTADAVVTRVFADLALDDKVNPASRIKIWQDIRDNAGMSGKAERTGSQDSPSGSDMARLGADIAVQVLAAVARARQEG